MRKLMQKLSLVFEKILNWAVITILLFIPLYMKFPLISVGGTFVSVRVEDLLLGITYLIWLIFLATSGKIKEFFRDRLNLTLMIFFAIGALSLFSAFFVTHTVTLELGLLHLLRRIEMIMLLPLAISIIKTRRQAYVFLGVLSLVLFIVIFYALGQRFLEFPAVSTTNAELSKGVVYFIKSFDRVISTFGGHYDLAVFLVIGLSMIAATIFYFFKTNIIFSAWLALLAVGAAIVLVMTAARLSFIAAIFGIVLAFFLVGKKKFILAIFLLAGLMLVYPSQLRDRFVSTFTVNLQKSWTGFISGKDENSGRSKLNIPTLPLTWEQRSSELQATDSAEKAEAVPADAAPGEPTDITDLGVYRSFEIRTQVEWPRAIRAFTKNPLLGTGYSSIGLAIDNDFLRSLGEVGLLGTFVFILVLTEATKRLVAGYRKSTGLIRYVNAGVLSMVAAFILNALFIDVFEASKTASLFWLILGITLALGKIEERKA
jgi:hypothetical protein